jgi:superfamily II DNA helicase RecQ
MQVRIFSVCPVQNPDGEELNKFLRTHRVLTMSECWSEEKKAWQFAVRFIGEEKSEPPRTSKTDYRELLNDDEFERFSRYREVRKQLADEDQVPVYMVFTNAELAQLAATPNLSVGDMLQIKGIGEKRVERYAERLLEKVRNNQ